MKSKKLAILETLAAYGCLSPFQMRAALPDIKIDLLYYWLKKFKAARLVERVTHPRENIVAYHMTLQGYKEVYGLEDIRIPDQRPADLAHTIYVSDVLMVLARYSFVKGFIRENAISGQKLKKFIIGRKPDAIIRLENTNKSYEAAVEVEASIKSIPRIDEILNAYEMTFNGGKECRGVIIVATDHEIQDAYKRRLDLRSPEFEKRVLLVSIDDIEKLNPAVYGKLEPKTKIPLKFDYRSFSDEERGQSNGYG